MQTDAVKNRYLAAQASTSKKYFKLHPKARNNAGRYIFDPTINYDGYVDGLDIYIIVDGKRHYIGDESYVDPDKPELKVSHTKAVKKVLIADHHIEMKSAVVPDDDSTRWPKIWDSSGTVYSLQPLVFPAEPYYNERKFGSYRVRKDDDDYHINTFRPHVKLPYNFNNFRIYVNENSYFMSNFPDAGVGWDEGPNLTNKDVRKVPFNTIPYTRMLLGAYIASYLSGVSMDHVRGNSSVSNIITSIMRYHLYYTIRKLTVSKSNIDELVVNLDVVKKHIPFLQTYILDGDVITVSAGPLSKNDYLSFIADKSNRFTKLGVELLQESIESFVYAMLGSQANTQWSIDGNSSNPFQTQRDFRTIVNDMILQSNSVVAINNMRKAVRDTNVILNIAISPGMVLIPSNFAVLNNPIPGYNNILHTAKGNVKFGFNPKVNYVGIKQDNPPKKQHQDSVPVHHLDTLGENTVVPKKAHTTLPVSNAPAVQRKPVKFHESSGNGALAGLSIGAIVAFLLLRIVL